MPAGALLEGFGRSISGCALVLCGIPCSAEGFRVQDSRLKVCLSRSLPHTTMEARNGNLQILWSRVHAVWRPRSASIQGPSFFTAFAGKWLHGRVHHASSDSLVSQLIHTSQGHDETVVSLQCDLDSQHVHSYVMLPLRFGHVASVSAFLRCSILLHALGYRR